MASKQRGFSQGRRDQFCDLNAIGRLVDDGRDPLLELASVAVQTSPIQLDELACKTRMPAPKAAMGMPPPATKLLGLAVNLLGLEVHEQPNSWAELWLTFKETKGNKFGLGSDNGNHRSRAVEGSLQEGINIACSPREDKHDWQMNVLQHLRNFLSADSNNMSIGTNRSWKTETKIHGEFISDVQQDPDLREHLELAEFALRKIIHAITILQDPEKQDRAMVLREYSEAMVLKVSQDLKQWLEQLAVMISLYHVHILDLEAKCRYLTKLSDQMRSKCGEVEKEQREAVRRHDVLQQHWQEDKMKKRAEVLLDIGIDKKPIFTQEDVDEMQRSWEEKWEKEYVKPLQDEVRELRYLRDNLQNKLKEQKKELIKSKTVEKLSPAPVAEKGLEPASLATLLAILDWVSQSTVDNTICNVTCDLSECLRNGGDLKSLMQEIFKLPSPSSQNKENHPLDENHPAKQCLSLAATELDSLEAQLRECLVNQGDTGLPSIIAWSRDMVNSAQDELFSSPTGETQWPLPPKWDLVSLHPRPNRAVGVNTEILKIETHNRSIEVQTAVPIVDHAEGLDLEKVRADMETAFQQRMTKLEEEFAAQLKLANERADVEKANAEEAMKKLETEAMAAQKLTAQLRQRLLDMERILKGQGRGMGEAMVSTSGVLDDLQFSMDVYQRLYQDALDRMRRHAELHSGLLRATSDEHLAAVDLIFRPSPGVTQARELIHSVCDGLSLQTSQCSRSGNIKGNPPERITTVCEKPSGNPFRSSACPLQAPSRDGKMIDLCIGNNPLPSKQTPTMVSKLNSGRAATLAKKRGLEQKTTLPPLVHKQVFETADNSSLLLAGKELMVYIKPVDSYSHADAISNASHHSQPRSQKHYLQGPSKADGLTLEPVGSKLPCLLRHGAASMPQLGNFLHIR